MRLPHMKNPILDTLEWFRYVAPNPTDSTAQDQLDSILREFENLKSGNSKEKELEGLTTILVDIIGYAYMKDYDVIGALTE